MIGILEPIRSVLLPAIRVDLNLSYSAIGALIFISFWGFLLGSGLGGFFSDRYGDKTMILIGALLILLATTAFFSIKRYLFLVAMMLVLRGGIGLLDIAISAHGGRIFTRRPALKMNLLHLCFGLGATLAPLYALLLFRQGLEWRSIYGLLAIPSLLLIFLILAAPYHHERSRNIQWRASFRVLAGERRILLLMLLMGCAIIFEGTVLEWSKNYFLEIRGFSEQRSNLYLTIFYSGQVVGRLINGLVCERLGELRTYLIYAVVIIILFSLFQIFSSLSFLFLILGWFMAPFFPIVMVLAARYYPNMTGGSMGIVLAVGGLIQSGFSFLVGIAHDLLGVVLGYATITLGMTLAIPVVLLLMREERRYA